MSKTITIAGTPIEFPTSGTSPDWAPAVDQFAEVVADALNTLVTAGDVSPQVYEIDAFNTPGFNNIPNLIFSNIQTRGATISYSVYRQTDIQSAVETGEMQAVFDTFNNAWYMSRQRTGDSLTDFQITGTGQIQFSVQTLPGGNYTGRISFSAKALQQA